MHIKKLESVMASEEDNFDIDIYGDGDEHGLDAGPDSAGNVIGGDGANDIDPNTPEPHPNYEDPSTKPVPTSEPAHEPDQIPNDSAQKIASTGGPGPDLPPLPKQAPQTQGLKREGSAVDERAVDPGATSALLVSDLDWWITDDDIRGWANQCRCEDELEEVTFSEHKVNGKSKGQVIPQNVHCDFTDVDYSSLGRRMCRSNLLKLPQQPNER